MSLDTGTAKEIEMRDRLSGSVSGRPSAWQVTPVVRAQEVQQEPVEVEVIDGRATIPTFWIVTGLVLATAAAILPLL